MNASWRDAHEDHGERGAALVLVLLIVVLLYIIVAEVVTRSQFDLMVAHNQAVEASLDEAFDIALAEVLVELGEDGAGGGGGLAGLGGTSGQVPPGGLGGIGAGGAGPPGGLPGGGEPEEPDPAAEADSSRDAWYRPKSYFDDNKITVYAFVEDENRKFNLLSLLSEDEDFAQLSHDRLVRLLDLLWDEAEEDLSEGDARIWAEEIEKWMRGKERSEERPAPPLKTKKEDSSEVLPLTLDELRLVHVIPEEAFDDRIVGDTVLRGLSAVLTIHTSLAYDPSAEQEEEGGGPEAGPEAGGAASGGAAAGGGEEELEAIGPGIRVNPNTAYGPVLHCLDPGRDVPDNVVEAILRYRNEEDEEAMDAAEDEELAAEDESFAGEAEVLRRVFLSVGDLGEIEEWENLPENDGKKSMSDMLTTTSNVFTIHLCAVYKRDEAGSAFIVARRRGVYLRGDVAEGGEAAEMIRVVPMHADEGLRLFIGDYPDEEDDLELYSGSLDAFAAEERLWNPFFLEFYDPEKRQALR